MTVCEKANCRKIARQLQRMEAGGMTDTQRFEQVRDIIADVLEINEANIALGMSLKDELGADDIDLFELVYQLEKELDFEAGGAWDGWQTVQDIIDTWKEQEAKE